MRGAVRQLERSSLGSGVASCLAAAPMVRRFGAYAAALTLIALLVPLHGLWAVQVLLVPLLLIVPGALLLQALRVPARAVSSFPVYVPCASLIVLIGSGLAVDALGFLIGVAAPLRMGPLLVGLELTCFALLATSVNAPSSLAIPWRLLSRPARFAWPLILSLLAAAGVLWFNNGHGAGLAVAATDACVLVLIAAIVFASELEWPLLTVILYAAS